MLLAVHVYTVVLSTWQNMRACKKFKYWLMWPMNEVDACQG